MNRRANEHAVDNLVWLCLDHHAEYDARSHQVKGWQIEEVRYWRNKLYETLKGQNREHLAEKVGSGTELRRFPDEAKAAESGDTRGNFWRFPLWQIPDRPEFFAFSASNRADGVCVVERIDLPDGRIVVACIQVPGNPGNSVTNAVETICQQVCTRFQISLDRLVWLENYDFGLEEWDRVTFRTRTADGGVADPEWSPMSQADWEDLQLHPRARLGTSHGDLISKLEKLFPWPPADDYMFED